MLSTSDSESASNSDSDTEKMSLMLLAVSTVCLTALQLCSTPPRRALHDSVFTGMMRIDEWYKRHPEGMKGWLGVDPDAFNFLLRELVTYGNLAPSRYVEMEEKLAIFLYICRSACGVRHAAEAFQRGLETTARAFREVLDAITSLAVYSRWVRMPTATDPPSQVIMDDSRFDQWFENCLGAIDGTHVPAHPPVAQASTYRTRKGVLTQNVLAAASFDFKFIYVLAGWEGSAHDGKIWSEALRDDLVVPDGKFLLADAGFSTCRQLLVPFRGVRYHLQEWAKSKSRPANARELYNLRHSSARNVIERIFGVAKRRWRILGRGCEWDIEVQARVVYAVAVLHNILQDLEHPIPEPIPTDSELRRLALLEDASRNDLPDDDGDIEPTASRPPTGPTGSLSLEKERGEAWRSEVAGSMWTDYENRRLEKAARKRDVARANRAANRP